VLRPVADLDFVSVFDDIFDDIIYYYFIVWVHILVVLRLICFRNKKKTQNNFHYFMEIIIKELLKPIHCTLQDGDTF
jgi:F0F1-type ATP synthase membrane subunit a